MENYKKVDGNNDMDLELWYDKANANVNTKELVAIKYIERETRSGKIFYFSSSYICPVLQNIYILSFLTPTHLAIVMEYANGGELGDFVKVKESRIQGFPNLLIFRK
ncbi:hypothetical protein GIB67_026834 [Kingdonia uniflora]|uniref:Protein kinase domain-containing protein n=1 Tax=Kingdonia uniflora TaxID=39325 RepID=A0A7J7MI22_9MAGN|nr:hypothetical protein GIB67_026834 [Kingdonia uniflora]